MGLEAGADLADLVDCVGRTVPCLGDLGLRHGGFRAGVGVGEIRYPGGTACDVMSCGLEVATAQRDHAENAVGDRAIAMRRQRPGRDQGSPAFGGGVAQAAHRGVHACAQDRRHRLRWDAMKSLGVSSPDDRGGFVEAAQVHQAGGKCEERLDMTSVGRDPGPVAGRVLEELKSLADPALVPADQRAGGESCRNDLDAVMSGAASTPPAMRPALR